MPFSLYIHHDANPKLQNNKLHVITTLHIFAAGSKSNSRTKTNIPLSYPVYMNTKFIVSKRLLLKDRYTEKAREKLCLLLQNARIWCQLKHLDTISGSLSQAIAKRFAKNTRVTILWAECAPSAHTWSCNYSMEWMFGIAWFGLELSATFYE